MDNVFNKRKQVEDNLRENDGFAIPMSFVGCISLLDAIIEMVKELPDVPTEMLKFLNAIQKEYLEGCAENAAVEGSLHLLIKTMLDKQLLGFHPKVKESEKTMEMVQHVIKGINSIVELESAEPIDSRDIPKQFH